MAQEKAYRTGLLARMNPCAYTSQLAEPTNEALYEDGLPPRSLHLPIAYSSNLSIPAAVKKADESDYFEIWQNFKVYEFGDLLQGHTFEPV